MNFPVGSFFVAKIPGPAGFWINVGQALAGDGSRYSHAGIIISAAGDVIEAEPGGARPGHLDAYRDVLVCDGPILDLPADEQAPARGRVVSAAHSLIGTPYSFLDYAALAALHLHLPAGWIRRRVESSGHAICSQLVDLAYEKAGIHLFTDGRLPGDVMPADLAAWAEDWETHRAVAG